MIQIILLILKIIGITLAVLLGLLFFLLALVLFVPIFYRVNIVHHPEKTVIDGWVRFLFPVLSFTFRYLKKFTYQGRLFWYVFLDSEKPKKEKQDKEKGKKKKKSQENPKEDADSYKETDAELPVDATDKEENAALKEETSETGEEARKEFSHEKEQEKASKPGFFESLRLKTEKIRETIVQVVKKIKKLFHQKDEILRILNEPSSKRAISFAWDKLKKMLKHILPRKMKGYVAYGANDPATTGQVLAVIGVLYAGTGPLLEIRPNFEEEQLECEIELRGHIQLFTLLVIVIKVLLNSEIRELIREFKKVKEVE